jgi:multiple sugar transport system ATP-binding protein
VALGRAMVRHPDVFLMDEPLSNLDAKLRVHMRAELAELHARIGVTFVYVTHDQVEAMTMSDRVAVMDAGRILQLGTPGELYERPATLKVAQFIGSPAINTLPARVGTNGRIELAGMELPIRVALPPASPLTIGVRPEAIVAAVASPRDGPALPARLRRTENLGAELIHYFDLCAPAEGRFVVRAPADAGVPAASEVALRFDGSACHLFDADGMRLAPIEVLSDRSRDRSVASSRGALP